MSFQNPTLLNVVNEILSDMGRDVINTLDATPEAARVLAILKDVYRQLATRNLWEHRHVHRQLAGGSDSSKPTKVILPEEVMRVKEISYRVAQGDYFVKLTHLYPEDFLRIVQGRTTASAEVTAFSNEDGVELRVFNDRPPSYWTSFDDTIVYLDSWDTAASSTIVGADTQAHVVLYPTFPVGADDLFDVPARFMPMYISTAKSICFEKIKQIASPSDQYWSKASYGRFLHDGSRVGQERPKKETYGKRRR